MIDPSREKGKLYFIHYSSELNGVIETDYPNSKDLEANFKSKPVTF